MQIFKRAVLIFLLGVLAFILPPVLLTTASYLYYHSADVILPGIRVGTVDVGYMTLEQAQQTIDQVYNHGTELLLIEVPAAERSWTVVPAEFGLQVDALDSALEAYHAGREGALGQQILTMLATLKEGVEFRPRVQYDEAASRRTLEAWGQILYEDASDAELILIDGEVQEQPARAGLALDEAHTLEILSSSFEEIYLEQGWLPLITHRIEPARNDVEQAAAELNALLTNTPEIQAYDPVTDERFIWSPDRETIASWLSIKDDGQSISIEIDPERVHSYIDDIETSLGPSRYLDREAVSQAILLNWSAAPSRKFIVSYHPTEYTVQPGDTLISISFKVHMPYWKLTEANPTLAAQGLSAGQKWIVPPRDDMLTLAVLPEKRIVISIREQRMWVYEQGELKWEYIVSTGIPNSPTMPGIYQINSHYENAYASIWDLYMPHFMGIYDAVPGLTNGIHGLPVLSSGRRLWANVLGSPASYGCIILDLEAAESLYNWAEEGVVVEIRD